MGNLVEAPLIGFFGRKVEREFRVGSLEAAMNVEMTRLDRSSSLALCRESEKIRDFGWLVAPLFDIDVRLVEVRVFRVAGNERVSVIALCHHRCRTPAADCNGGRGSHG